MRAREYRVVWQRAGERKRVRRYATRAAAERWLLLFGPEPWRAVGKDPDAYWCCSGRECGCEGATVRESFESERAERPALLFVRLEARPVGRWREAA